MLCFWFQNHMVFMCFWSSTLCTIFCPALPVCSLLCPFKLQSFISQFPVCACLELSHDMIRYRTMCYSLQPRAVLGDLAVIPLVAEQQDVRSDLLLAHVACSLNEIVRVKLECGRLVHASTLR